MPIKAHLKIAGAVGAMGLGAGLAAGAHAAETKTYVVSYFGTAMNNTDGDCPGGLNPLADGILKQILASRGMTPAEIQAIAEDDGRYEEFALMRGRIDGKPADIYLNPTSAPDPKSRTVETKVGVGFNLDGRDDPDDMTDPFTGEKGVDNTLFKVLGCDDRLRGTPTTRPIHAEIAWDNARDGMPAWLVRISGIDSYANDDAVEVEILPAVEKAGRDVAGGVQTHMSFTIDPNPRMRGNTFRGRIRDGLFVSDVLPKFFMVADIRVQPYFDFKDARLRLQFKPDGTVEGYMGGFAPWDLTYLAYAMGRARTENATGINAPGLYHALRRMADSDIDKDPKTGMRTRISATFQIAAAPAYITSGGPQQVAAPAERRKKKGAPLAMAGDAVQSR